MKTWTVVSLCLWLGVGMSTAQAQQENQPSPDDQATQVEQPAQGPGERSAEVSELEFFVGHWTTSGQSRATPASEFAPLSGEETCEWFAGGTAVVCRETMADGNGSVDSIYILA